MEDLTSDGDGKGQYTNYAKKLIISNNKFVSEFEGFKEISEKIFNDQQSLQPQLLIYARKDLDHEPEGVLITIDELGENGMDTMEFIGEDFRRKKIGTPILALFASEGWAIVQSRDELNELSDADLDDLANIKPSEHKDRQETLLLNALAPDGRSMFALYIIETKDETRTLDLKTYDDEVNEDLDNIQHNLLWGFYRGYFKNKIKLN